MSERAAVYNHFYPTLSRAPERDGWSAGQVTIQMRDPKERLIVEAWRRGPFAVHETVGGATLTHVPTGFAVCRFNEMEQCAECAERIEGFDDFAARDTSYPVGSDVYPKVRTVIDDINASLVTAPGQGGTKT